MYHVKLKSKLSTICSKSNFWFLKVRIRDIQIGEKIFPVAVILQVPLWSLEFSKGYFGNTVVLTGTFQERS